MRLTEYVEQTLAQAAGYDIRSLDLMQNLNEIYRQEKRKDTVVPVRLSEDVKQQIREQATLAGVSVSEYIRCAVTGKEIVTVIDGKKILYQLAKVGTNLNQLTMLAHEGKITCPDLYQVKKTHERILKELIRIVKKRR